MVSIADHFSNTHLYTCGLARTSNSRDQAQTYLKCICLIWLILETILIIVFTVRDLLVFTFFEAVLIPMFLLVGLFGSRPRNIRAGYKMFLFTLAGHYQCWHFNCLFSMWFNGLVYFNINLF
jgi:NADH:ubiquinone oxidoreductase subunit 4 (subunit M)